MSRDEIIAINDGICDFHCHLRQGPLMSLVTPLLYEGGTRTALVMPNLEPPLIKPDDVVEYARQLNKIEPRINYLTTMYLTENTKSEDILLAAKLKITGIKLYPAGVTTNSKCGIENIEKMWPLFKSMEDMGLVLNIHAESANNTTPITAEEDFLPTFENICTSFPRLRVVFEHCTTEKGVEMVKSLGSNVAATITLHHLSLTCNDWIGQNNGLNYCKPVAKLPKDRISLRNVVKEGNKKFFLGTDSAPHPNSKKASKITHAGIYTGAYTAAYTAHILEQFDALDNIVDFSRKNGCRFYGVDPKGTTVYISKSPTHIKESFSYVDDNGMRQELSPFMAGEVISWKVVS